MKAPKYISRTDAAWRLRIRHRKREEFNKHFNFDKYGGIKHALYAAIEMRDQLLKKYGMFEFVNRQKSPDLQTLRKSKPCIGIFRARNIQNGKTFYNWTVTIHKDGKQSKRHFSINMYGEELAFLLACEARFKHSGPLIIVNKKALPCKPSVPYIIKG